MPRTVFVPALACALALGTGCTAQDLATAATVAAGVLAEQPAGTAGGPVALPSGGPFSRPSAGPVAVPSGLPVALPSGAPVVGPVIAAADGAFRWTPRWTEAAYPGEPDVEALVFRYTNEARAAEGLPPLARNTKLDVAARQHSREMIELDYFDHTSPVAGHASVSDRQQHAGYLASGGENIYDYYELEAGKLARELVDGWMKSPGHRANILRAGYRDLGVGLHRGGGRVMATQVFGTGQVVDVTAMTLAASGGGYRVRVEGVVGDTPYRSVTVTVDGEPVGAAIPATPGEKIAFEATIPAGGAHELGLDRHDPADGGRRFWPLALFTIDTSKPVDQAVR